MFKTFPITVDLVEKTNNDVNTVLQNDMNSIKFIFNITNEGTLVDLSNTRVQLVTMNREGVSNLRDCTIEEGECSIVLDTSMYDVVGLYQANLIIYQDDRVVESRSFNYLSNKSILNDKTILSDNGYQAINKTVFELQLIQEQLDKQQKELLNYDGNHEIGGQFTGEDIQVSTDDIRTVSATIGNIETTLETTVKSSENTYNKLSDVVSHEFDTGAIYISYAGRQVPYPLGVINNIVNDNTILRSTSPQVLSMPDNATTSTTPVIFDTVESDDSSFEGNLDNNSFVINNVDVPFTLYANGIAEVLTTNQYFGGPATLALETIVNGAKIKTTKIRSFTQNSIYEFDYLPMTKGEIETLLDRSLVIGDEISVNAVFTRSQAYANQWSVTLKDLKFSLINTLVSGNKTGIKAENVVAKAMVIYKDTTQPVAGIKLFNFDGHIVNNCDELIYNKLENYIQLNLDGNATYDFEVSTHLDNLSTTDTENVSIIMLVETFNDETDLYEPITLQGNTASTDLIPGATKHNLKFKKVLRFKSGKHKIYFLIKGDKGTAKAGNTSETYMLGSNLHQVNRTTTLTVRETLKL